MSLQTAITQDHLRKSLAFAVKYYLNPNKVLRKRSSQQERRLGEIIDDFISGKIIELGVIDILKQINPKKTCLADFDIHDDADYDDPDIVGVIDEGSSKSRKPGTFVEIKNNDESDQWTGLYTTQWTSINNHTLVDNGDNLYIVYASIKTRGNTQIIYEDVDVQERYSKRIQDVLGILLSGLLEDDPTFENFLDSNHLYVEIDRILTGTELREHGRFFNASRDEFTDEDGHVFSPFHADSFWNIRHDQSGRPQLFEKVVPERNFTRKDGTVGWSMEQIQPEGNVLPLDPSVVPRQFGNFEFTGQITDIFRSQSGKRSIYFNCATDVTVTNDFIGEYFLAHDIQYKMTFNKTGAGDCKSDNLLLPIRIIQNIASPAENRIKEIAERI